MLVEVSATLQLLDVFPLWDSTDESDDGRNKTPVNSDETISKSPEPQSLQFEAGELVLVTGLPGSGKSRMAKRLTQHRSWPRGRVTWKGRDLAHMSVDERFIYRKQCAVIHGRVCLHPQLDVRQNIALPLELTGLDKKVCDVRVSEQMERFELHDWMRRRIDVWDLELAQRVAWARAFAAQPELLVADEPFVHLHPRIAETIFAELERQTRRGTCVVVLVRQWPTGFQQGTLRWIRLHAGEVQGDWKSNLEDRSHRAPRLTIAEQQAIASPVPDISTEIDDEHREDAAQTQTPTSTAEILPMVVADAPSPAKEMRRTGTDASSVQRGSDA